MLYGLCGGIQEALMPPAAPQPEAEPLVVADQSAQPAQQPSAAQPEARHEEDAVDRAAAAQLQGL